MSPTYGGYSKSGDELERAGKSYEAATEFKKAARVAFDQRDKCTALHRAAINLRVAKQYEDAEYTFEEALANSNGGGQELRIKRDMIMARVLSGRVTSEDESTLDEIYSNQLKVGMLLEAGVTLGFIARLDLKLGKSRDAALLDFSEADRLMRKSEYRNRVYELNNLIHWMKNENFIKRFILGPRAIYLALKTGYRIRAIEASILMTGGPKIYEKLKQRG